MNIQVVEVTKQIRKNLILDNVSLEMESGKIYGLQGPNGSGKTMLMRLLCGLIKANKGKVLLDGKEIGKDIDFPESVGLLIENPAFWGNYNGLKNLELLAELQKRIDTEQIRETISDVGLDPDDKRHFSKYSLGMKQRLGIAAAIMEKPEIILLDEPTNALDERGVAEICDLIRREKERGALIVIACHDADILENLADEIYTIYEGRVERKR